MITFPKSIKVFNKKKIKINKNLLLVGSGRWAKVILDEIIKNYPYIKIYIYTNNFVILKKWIESKKYTNVFQIKNLQKIKEIKCDFAIVANKSKNHFSICHKLLKLNFNVLVEKPFTLNLKDANKLIKLSYRKKLFLLVGLQFFYAKYFYFIRKILKKFKIKEIKIEWFDKQNEIRNKILKIHDPKVNYLEDVFYHVYSILEVLLGKKKYVFRTNSTLVGKKNTLFFNYQKQKIILQCSRSFSIRKRMIKIYFYKNHKLFINFSKDLKIQGRIDKNLIKFPKYVIDTTLKYQLFFFLNLKNYKSDLLPNDIRNLNNLLLSLKNLRKFI
jgi:hypothetical protein